MSVYLGFSNATYRGISASEVKAVFKEAAVDGFSKEEAADLRAALTTFKDSFTPAGRAEYDKQIKKVVDTVELYSRLTPSAAEKRTFVPSSVIFGGTADVYSVPVTVAGKSGAVTMLSDNGKGKLQVKLGRDVRDITNVEEARAIATALKANPLTANSAVARAADAFSSPWDFSALTFRSGRAQTNQDRSLTVFADNGMAFTLLNGVVTINASIARRELFPSEYATLAKVIPYNKSIELNALYFAANRKSH